MATMTKDVQQVEFSAQINQMQHLAREPFQAPEELVQLRRRIKTERERTHDGIIKTIAKEARVDLDSIFEEARRRNAVKRRYVTETLNRLEAETAERAREHQRHVHQIRTEYLKTFRRELAAQAGTTELKFRDPVTWAGDAQKGDCSYIVGGTSADAGFHEASAEILPSPDSPGMWLHPRIFSDSGDCDDTRPGTSFHNLTYQMGPPATSFAVSSVRVDLLANGMGSSVLGDPGCFREWNPYFEHSFIVLDVHIAQQVNGVWHEWPLLSDKLFSGAGEYVKQIRPLLSGQTYPANIILRKADAGGGALLCHVQVACSARALGADGRVLLDFSTASGLGIFLGGVALLGGFV